MDTPISETAFIGAATGAAAEGMRPIAELMFVDFFGVCMDQIYNHLAKNTYMSGGNVKLPVVLMTAIGGGYGDAAQHSQCLYSIFAHVPGLKVVVPSNAYDAKGLMIQAIRDDNPVMYFFHKGLMGLPWMSYFEGATCEVPNEAYTMPFGQARIAREGRDVTIVALSQMVQKALAAAAQLETEGIMAEVVDLRTLVPLDTGHRAGLGGEDRAPAGRRRGLSQLRPERRDRRGRGRAARPHPAEGTGAQAGRAGCADSLQPAAGAGGHPVGRANRASLSRHDGRRPGAGGMKEVVLDPGLWESLEAGVEALLEEWLVAEGDHVQHGQVLARAVLVKATIELPAPASGVLEEILVAVGQTFARGAVLARLIET